MVKILIDLPNDVDKYVSIYSIESGLKDKRMAVVQALRQYFSPKKS